MIGTDNSREGNRMAQEFYTTGDAAKLLRVSVVTLAKWRAQGRGPRAFQVNRRWRYAAADLDAFIAAQRKGHSND